MAQPAARGEDRSAVKLYQALYQREPDAKAARLPVQRLRALDKQVEYTIEHRRVDAYSLVGDA